MVLFSAVTFGQQTDFWTLSNEGEADRDLFLAAKSQRPSAFKIFKLNEAAFKSRMANAPSEKTVSAFNSGFIVSFPVADGSLQQFRVVDAPCMEPGLAAKYPGIHSYAGQGVQNPSANIRFDVSMHGVHATIRSGDQSPIYIDQLYENYYRVVKRSDVTGIQNSFRCLTDDMPGPASGGGGFTENADDGKLRTYRLAMISGAEFSLHFIPPGGLPTLADSIAAVIAAQNSHVTRTNQVYERDFGVRLLLVANNNLLVYFDPATDPVSPAASPNNGPLQAAIDAAIGSGNYDIGHTESKGADNGNAGCIGCVCTVNQKGRGWTVYANPSLLEFFVIDYLTHEMGHQFGANHTFSFQLESGGINNIEPGSGITIMGYAGITGGTDIAPHSIDIFSVRSIEQITNYIKTGGGSGCDVEIVTGNTAPTANGGSDWTIPFSTPFKLTGTASDPDPGDVLKYNWEQTDSRDGSFPSIPVATATNGPMFRTYLDYTIPERTFPSLQYILTGANGFQWEVLPSVGRPLNFRFIAKDNHVGGGNTKSDDVLVTVSATTGPFLITSQNAAVSYPGGSAQTVTWSVNGTTGAPINCANVRILFSSDGGLTFPTVLAASTANDGTESITIPVVTTTTGRIKVEAIGNIFFDINNASITVTVPLNGFTFNSPAAVTAACPAPNIMTSGNLTATYAGTFTGDINLSGVVIPAGPTVSFSTNPLTTGTPSTTVSLTGMALLSPGNYTVTVTGVGVAGPTVTRDIVFTINPGSGPAITGQPVSTAVCAGTNASFAVTATGTYQWQVSTAAVPAFTNIVGQTAATLNLVAVTAGMSGNQYRCVVTGQCGSTNSNAATLTVNVAPSVTGNPTSLSVCSGSAVSFTAAGTGTPAPTYQWQVSTTAVPAFTNIPGATSATYNIASVLIGQNNDQYRCVISNVCGSVNTTAATLIVSSSITISTNPVDQTVCEATNTSFIVAAAGSGLLYQWEISVGGGGYTTLANGGVYSGATSATLVITGVPPSLNGNRYRCVVSNGACTPGVSTGALLTVNTFPAINTQPQNLTVCEGAGATFSVAATTGVGSLSYQWQLSTNGGGTYNNITGATNSSFVQAAVPVGQNGYRFRVIVTAGCGSVTSTAGILTVNAFPVITFLPTFVVCVSDAAFSLSATPAGGAFSGPGVSGSTFTPSVAGVGAKTVTYTANNAGCQSAVSRTIQVNECAERHRTLSQYPAVIVYPVPNNGTFSIKLNTDLYTTLNIKLYNSMGQLVKSQVATGLTYGSVIPVSVFNAPSGTYQLFLSNEERGEVSTKGVSVSIYR